MPSPSPHTATPPAPAPAHSHAHHPAHHPAHADTYFSVLAWPAWLRVLALLPVIALLWLAVAWAALEVAPW